MKRIKLLPVVIVGMLFVASQAWAGPIGVTNQTWDFTTNANPAIPELDENPFGTAEGTIVGSLGGPPPEWVEKDFFGRDGVWTAEGLIDITLEVPNQEIRNPYKVILLEIGFRGDSDLPAFSVAPTFLTSPGGPVVVRKISQDVVVDDATGWSTLFAEWYIEPNPDSESICYSFSGNIAAVDYVNVYTECVPEPMTIALLGFGGLMLRRKRKA
jgi:hypothetical protein